MGQKKPAIKKKLILKNIKLLLPKKVDVKKFRVDGSNLIENTKKKIEKFYVNLKKQRAKNKKK